MNPDDQRWEDAAKAVRMVETGDNYKFQAPSNINGQRELRVGAYGIRRSRWAQLAAAAGIPDADWRDPYAQDLVAKSKLIRDHQEFQDWTLAALAFRFGTKMVRRMVETAKTSAEDLDMVGLKEQAEYMRRIVNTVNGGNNAEPFPATGTTPRKPADANKSATRRRADDIVRSHLIALRNSQRKSLARANATQEPTGGNDGQPNIE